MSASAIYDLLFAATRGDALSDALLRRASRADAARWERVLRYERCGPAVWEALLEQGHAPRLSTHVRALLRDAAQLAVHQSLRVAPQMARLAALAARANVRLMPLKGAARLLGGAHFAASRAMDDIDLLADTPDGAMRLHQAMQRELGYVVVDETPDHHHLNALALPGWLPVELHTRLARRSGADGARIDMWRGARALELGGAPVWLPSPTALAQHTLAHATSSRMLRYALRDVVDVAQVVAQVVARVAAAGDGDAGIGGVVDFVRASTERRAMETLLGAAHSLDAAVPRARLAEASWRAVRRVGRMRARIAVRVQGRDAARRLIAAGGALAECSPRGMMALGWRAVGQG